MRTIPFFRQINEHYCGPAVLQMVLAAFGIRVSQHKLAKEAKTPIELHAGTELTSMVRVLRSYGFRVRGGNHKTIAHIKRALTKGAIVLICYTEPIMEWGHYAIVKEFRRDRIILIDPDSRTGTTSMLTVEFKRRWKDPLFTRSVRWAVFVEKPRKKKK